MRKIYQRFRRLINIAIVVILLLIGLRVAAPYVALRYANQYLAEFSPIYRGHIVDLSLFLWRGAYKFEGVSFTLKDQPTTFANIQDVEVSIAWRELLLWHVRVDVLVNEARILYSDDLRKKVLAQPEVHKEDAEGALDVLIPISIDSVVVKKSSLGTADFFGITDRLPTALTDVSARVTHITTDARRQIMYFEAAGQMPGGSYVHVDGDLNTFRKSKTGAVKLKLEDFQTTQLNPWMIYLAPLSFEKGLLTLFSEVKIEGSTVSGYFKPFVKDLHVVGDKMDFTSFRQFGIEISVAILNALFQDKNDNLATQVDFKYAEGKLEWNFWDVLKNMIKNSNKNHLEKSFNSDTLKK